jgi:recombination protein RecT
MQQTTEIVSFDDRMTKASDWLLGAKMQEALTQALPRGVDPLRLTRLFFTECRRIPDLLECTGESLFGSVLEIAQLGLDIGTRGHAWILPFRVKGTKTATVVIGYKGMLDLAWRSDRIQSVYAHEVFDGDIFEYEFGSEQRIRHTPAPDATMRKIITHAYAGCETISGGKLLDVMSVADIEKIRQRARAKDKGPWVTDYPQMCCKTVLRRMLKLAPCSVELSRAITLDEQAEVGLAQHLGAEMTTAPDVDPDTQLKCEACEKVIVPEIDNHFTYADGARCDECGSRGTEPQ